MELRLILDDIRQSTAWLGPELVLAFAMLANLALSLRKQERIAIPLAISVVALLISLAWLVGSFNDTAELFGGMLRIEGLATSFRILIEIGGLLTFALILPERRRRHFPEFCFILLGVVIGCHFLVMSNHATLIFLSLETVSIGSYVLAGYLSDRHGSEASMKYFLFGSAASAVMLYGFSFLYGITGTLNILSEDFMRATVLAVNKQDLLFSVAVFLCLAGYLFKVSAVPMHAWVPDVYQGAPMPVVAFLSVVPKVAGMGALLKFAVALTMYRIDYRWETTMAIVALLTITFANAAALSQRDPRRMMGWSSIAQSGFMIICVAAMTPSSTYILIFYAAVYILMNFLVFCCLQYFEGERLTTIESYAGQGKYYFWPTVSLLIGLIALTGLPPTAGFTAKLFVFSGLWDDNSDEFNPIFPWLFVIGLLNTVVSLFYYLKIPYYAFLKDGRNDQKPNFILSQYLIMAFLVIALFVLFFAPGLLMGWINKAKFVF